MSEFIFTEKNFNTVTSSQEKTLKVSGLIMLYFFTSSKKSFTDPC